MEIEQNEGSAAGVNFSGGSEAGEVVAENSAEVRGVLEKGKESFRNDRMVFHEEQGIAVLAHRIEGNFVADGWFLATGLSVGGNSWG
jgi:hypothetical protein